MGFKLFDRMTDLRFYFYLSILLFSFLMLPWVTQSSKWWSCCSYTFSGYWGNDWSTTVHNKIREPKLLPATSVNATHTHKLDSFALLLLLLVYFERKILFLYLLVPQRVVTWVTYCVCVRFSGDILYYSITVTGEK